MQARVVHLTTTHARDEVRIFHKECKSVVKVGYDVHLIVADGQGNDEVNGIKRYSVGLTRGRFQRVFIQPWKIYLLARKLRASIYHLHEPELLIIAPILKLMGAHVVYDSHEDVPRAVLGRDWVNPLLKRLLSFSFELFENSIVRRISAIVAATPHIALRFSKINSRTIVINNFPLLSEIYTPLESSKRSAYICYVGGISRIRGLFEMMRTLDLVDTKLVLAGPFEDANTKLAVKKISSWSKVNYMGIVSRNDVYQIMTQACAGLLLFYPEPNHINAQPNKMFEYMSAGIPVIASDFPLWREIIKGVGCGILVDPLNPEAIANAIRRVLENPEEAEEMGQRGRKAVEQIFNWDVESIKLINLYKGLLNSTG
jgi:glycosyltransferase involved in cell wall biosynthesis